MFGSASSTLVKTEITNTLQLGVMSQLRGIDSTGLAIAGRPGNGKKQRHKYDVTITKDIIPSGYFLNTKQVGEAFKEVTIPSAILGHCRAATIGEVNPSNAHPFECGDIVGVHNGTLNGDLASEARKLGITDSEMFYRELADTSLQKALDKCGLTSAYAFVWIDKTDHTLNMLRNQRRPLYLMYNKGNTTVYWASEKGMLSLLAEREGESYFEEPFLLKDDVLVTMELGGIKCKNTEGIRPRYIPPVIPPFRKSDDYEYAKDDWWNNMTSTGTAQSRRAYTPPARRGSEDEIPWVMGDSVNDGSSLKHPKAHLYYKYYDNTVVPVRRILPILEIGCANCLTKADPDDKTHWMSKVSYLCDECMSVPFVREYMAVGTLGKTYTGGIYKVPGSVEENKTKDERIEDVDLEGSALVPLEKPTCH